MLLTFQKKGVLLKIMKKVLLILTISFLFISLPKKISADFSFDPGSVIKKIQDVIKNFPTPTPTSLPTPTATPQPTSEPTTEPTIAPTETPTTAPPSPTENQTQQEENISPTKEVKQSSPTPTSTEKYLKISQKNFVLYSIIGILSLALISQVLPKISNKSKEKKE